MEEKRTLKNFLSTFALMLAMIVIVIMGVVIYKFYQEKTEANKKYSELQLQMANLNEKTNTLSENVGNVITNSTSNNTITNSTTNTTTTSFTDIQVKTTASKFLELQAHANCDSLLENLTERGLIDYDYSQNTELDNGQIVTNVKFSDYKKAMLNYVTENEFEKDWSATQHFSENEDGYLTKFEGGGGLREYVINNMVKKEKLTYKVSTTSSVDGEYILNDTYEITFKDVDGKCVIDSIK